MNKFFQQLNLRTKIISGVMLISLIIAAGVSIYSNRLYQEELRREALGKLQIMTVGYAGNLSKNSESSQLSANDLPLASFERLLLEIDLYAGSYGQLINSSGNIVLHPDTSMIDRPFTLVGEGSDYCTILRQCKMSDGVIVRTAVGNDLWYYSFVPVAMSNSDPWLLCISVSEKSLLSRANSIYPKTIALYIIGLLLFMGCVVLLVNNIISPVADAGKVLYLLSLGQISKTDQLEVRNNDEIGKISKALNSLTQALKEILAFAKNIEDHNYSVNYHLLSEDDELGKEMLEMCNSIKESELKNRQFKVEEERRNWVNRGLAEFSDILRDNSHSIETLSHKVISYLVKYLNANQGGLFILNDDNAGHPYLQLSACYAYERQKYMEKNIEIGEGLVGACFQEGETIYMNDVPDGYLNITSGLGTANPRCIVIMPLKINDKVCGVIEIASFQDILPYQIDFLEKTSINIASTITSVKINLHTTQLLEQSKKQAQILNEQEEEMRQNLEELMAVQEDMELRSEKLEQSKNELSEMLTKVQNEKDLLEKENAGYRRIFQQNAGQ